MLEARIVEIEEEEVTQTVTKQTDKSKEVKIDSPSIKQPKITSEPAAKEEMEALAENEELIRDWLDDTA